MISIVLASDFSKDHMTSMESTCLIWPFYILHDYEVPGHIYKTQEEELLAKQRYPVVHGLYYMIMKWKVQISEI